MTKKEADRIKKEQAKLASQFTEVPEQRAFSWHPLDAVALALFAMIVMLFFV